MYKKYFLTLFIIILSVISVGCSFEDAEFEKDKLEKSESEKVELEKSQLKKVEDTKVKKVDSQQDTRTNLKQVDESLSLINRNFENSISLRRSPLVGDINDNFKFRVVVSGDQILNPTLKVFSQNQLVAEYPFYNDGQHNDNLADDLVHVVEIDPLPKGTYSTSVVYTQNNVQNTFDSSEFVVIDPIDAECKPVVDNSGEINVVIATVDYGSSSDDLAQNIFDFEGVNGGILSFEPFKSNRDLFNLWVVDDVVELSDYSLLSSMRASDSLKKGYGLFTACNLPNQFNVLLYNHPGNRVGIAAMGYAQISPTADLMGDLTESNLNSIKRTVVHEFGHAFGDLTDEYIGHGLIAQSPDEDQCFFSSNVECFPSDEGGEVCRETQESRNDCLEKAPWSSLIGMGETYELEVGCYLGCGLRRNLYRSNINNIMNTGNNEFGLVNEIELCQKIYDLTGTSNEFCQILLDYQ